ncbi:MAG: hypothetical protein JWM47_2357, partial [Acidimicrobiales bacterium]|nr:hypothetical protein [Acidimicrobiales bacterium]
RVAQELLAIAVPKGEETILRVTTDGADLVVSTESIDADGEPVALSPLSLPPGRLDAQPGSVRLHDVLFRPVDRAV